MLRHAPPLLLATLALAAGAGAGGLEALSVRELLQRAEEASCPASAIDAAMEAEHAKKALRQLLEKKLEENAAQASDMRRTALALLDKAASTRSSAALGEIAQLLKGAALLDPGIADEAAKMERRAAKLSEELAAEAEAEKQRLERQVAVGDSIQIMENGESRRKKVAGLTGVVVRVKDETVAVDGEETRMVTLRMVQPDKTGNYFLDMPGAMCAKKPQQHEDEAVPTECDNEADKEVMNGFNSGRKFDELSEDCAAAIRLKVQNRSPSERKDMERTSALRSQGLQWAPGKVMEVTDSTFESGVKADELVLLKFYAPWCAHCQALAEPYAEAARAMGAAATLAVLDVTKNDASAEKFGIKCAPPSRCSACRARRV